MAAQEANLELGSLLGIDMSSRQPAKPGGYPVDGAILGDNILDQLSRRRHPHGNVGANPDCGVTIGDVDHIGDRKRPSVNGYNPHWSSLIADPLQL
jgi:hypothetical protein